MPQERCIWVSTVRIHFPVFHGKRSSTLLCPALYDPMGCGPPDSSAHGILQARIPGMGVPSPTPRDLPDPGIKPKLLRLLHWQAGSLSLSHLGSPPINVFIASNNPSAHGQAGAARFCYRLDRVWTYETNILNDSRSSNHHSPAVAAHGGGGGPSNITRGRLSPASPSKGRNAGHTLA